MTLAFQPSTAWKTRTIHTRKAHPGAHSAPIEKPIRPKILSASAFRPPDMWVILPIRRSDHSARIVVDDSGPGVPEDMRDKVFERFYRSEHSRHTPGSGLGLALVKAVAQLHDGRVALENRAPGLRVELDLPLADPGTPG